MLIISSICHLAGPVKRRGPSPKTRASFGEREKHSILMLIVHMN